MGIPGLTTFMNNEFGGWEHQVLEGYLVIDGGSLYHCLYTFQWNHGGEYLQYSAAVLDMFKALLQANIRPVVVFDGVDCNRDKVDTTLKRRQESIKFIRENLTRSVPSRNVLPLLAKEVFQLTLKEINVPFYVVDGEADSVIVEIANCYDCPVLGSDSDFFMFNVERGYIPIDRFHWKTQPVSCEVFHLSRFYERFAIKHADVRFAIPAIIGNDCLSSFFTDRLINHLTMDRDCVPRAQRVARLVRCLGQYSSVGALIHQIQGAPHASELEANYHKAQEMYNCTKQTDPESLLTCSVLTTAKGEAIPNWIISRFRRGDFSRHSMNALVLGETILKICPDVSRNPSSLYASLPIRQKLYYLLNISIVKEITRQGSDGLSPRRVNSLPVSTVSPQSLSPYPLQVLCEVLDCELSSFEELEDVWKLVAMVTKYWVKVTNVPTHLVEALISCHVVCYICNARLNDLRRKCVCSSAFKYRYKWETALHAFTQWQCCYLDALSVNQLLSPPLKVISPALLYDGTIAMFMAEDVSAVPTRFPVDLRLYRMIRSVVLQDRSAAALAKTCGESSLKSVSKSVGSAKKTRGESKKQSQPLTKTSCSSEFAHSNPFSILQTSDSDSNSD